MSKIEMSKTRYLLHGVAFFVAGFLTCNLLGTNSLTTKRIIGVIAVALIVYLPVEAYRYWRHVHHT